MSYRYYKIGLCESEFNNGFNTFINNDSKFSKVLSDNSKKLKIDIYNKYNKAVLNDWKVFNYVVVNVEGENLNNDSLSLIFGEYLKSIDIQSRKINGSGLYLIFVVIKTHAMNDDLMEFIKKGLSSKRKNRYSLYSTIPVVFEDSKETLYVGCYPGNKVDFKWFSKDMIIWILENLQKNNIQFNKIGLVKSEENEEYVDNSSKYESIYNKRALLEYETKKITNLFVLVICICLMCEFLDELYLIILFGVITIVGLVDYIYTFYINEEKYYSKFNMIKLKYSNMLDFKENLNRLLEKNNKKELNSFIFIDRYMPIDLDKTFNNNQNYYVILIDDYYEQDLLDFINKKSKEDKNKFLILKQNDIGYLKFIKDDNVNMKKRFLKIIRKLL